MRKGILTGIVLLLLITASAELQELEGTANRDFRSAKMYLNQQNYEKAMPLYESVLASNPYHIESLISVAGIYYDARSDYKTAYDLYARTLAAIDSVYAEYEELLQSDKKAAKKYHKKYIRKADLEENKENVEKFMQSCWTHLFQEGYESYQMKDYETALKKYNLLYEIAPDSLKTVKMLANSYFQNNETENGIKFYEKAYELDPGNEETARVIAYNYLELENREKAIEWYLQAIEDNPANVDNFYNVGILYDQLNRKEEALEMFDKVIQMEPDNADAIYNAKIIAQQLDMLDAYVSYSAMEFENTGYDAQTLSVFCYQLHNMEAYNYVLEYGEKWSELAPNDPAPLQLMVAAANKLGNKQLVKELGEKLGKMD